MFIFFQKLYQTYKTKIQASWNHKNQTSNPQIPMDILHLKQCIANHSIKSSNSHDITLEAMHGKSQQGVLL